MVHTSLVSWMDPQAIIHGAGTWALLVVCLIVFAETGLLVGFILPGDTLLLVSGVLSAPGVQIFHVHVAWVALAIAVAAFLGGELGYYIGHKAGRPIFERRESGLFSRENVARTNVFFDRFGPGAVVVARFVPVVRTFAPVAAGVGRMPARRYSLYNAIGAVLWAGGMVYLGYALHLIPPVQHFVESYFDMILLAAVVLAVVPAGIQVLRARSKARRAEARDESA
ncbi:DedA family protein [Xylanimonas sp. McL0601]|uniref:DedA family protein n=1 Tax=Xylanimonas sp. McL0601 TaxID=3414739 RepID=UPI003CF6B54D